MSALTVVLWVGNVAVLVYFLAINTVYAALLVVAAREMRQLIRSEPVSGHDEVFRSPFTPGVTVLVPAYNESLNVIASVTSLLALRYPDLEVVVVNDGSKDDTMQVLAEAFALEPVARVDPQYVGTQHVREVYRSTRVANLTVVDKDNGGKADALNCAINFASKPLVAAIDADAILERDALLRIVGPFLDDPADTIAVGGIIRIANGCTVRDGEMVDVRLSTRSLVRYQVVEYLRSFLIGRTGWSVINGLLIISGAFGVFRRDAVLRVGGYDTTTVGEDAELVVRLHDHFRRVKRPYRVVFVPDPICWTEAPETTRILGRQRRRWQRGLLDTLVRHRRMFFNPRYGVVGMLAYPYQVIFEALGPVIEALGYAAFVASIALGLMNWPFAILFFLVAVMYGVILSTASILVEELTFRRYRRWRDVLTLIAYAVLENVGYRQLHTYWRLRGIVEWFKGVESWGDMERRGITGTPAA